MTDPRERQDSVTETLAQPPEAERPPVTARSMMRNTAVAWAGEVTAKAASLVFFAVMARTLGEDGLGGFIFSLSLSGLLVLAAGIGTDKLLEVEVSRRPERARDYVAAISSLKTATAGLLLTVAAVAMVVSGQSRDVWLAFCLIGAGVYVEDLSKTRYAAFVAFERMKYMSRSIVVQRIATSAIGVALLLAGADLVVAGLVYLGGAALGLAVSEWTFRGMTRELRPAERRSISWRWLIRAGLPIGMVSLLFTLLLQFDTVLLGLLTGGDGHHEVGYFGAAYRVVEATMFLVWYVGSAVTPWVARAADDEPGAVARGYELGLKAVTALLIPLAVGFAVLAAPLVRLLYGEGYGDAVLPLQLLSAMTVLYGINHMTTTFFIGRDRPGALGWLLGGVVVQNIAFNLVLIPQYGAVGAAFNAVLSSVVLAGLGVWRAGAVLGRIRPLRPFVTPLVAGTAMAAAMAATAGSPFVSLAVGAVTYPSVFALTERVLFPEDFARWRHAAARARASA